MGSWSLLEESLGIFKCASADTVGTSITAHRQNTAAAGRGENGQPGRGGPFSKCSRDQIPLLAFLWIVGSEPQDFPISELSVLKPGCEVKRVKGNEMVSYNGGGNCMSVNGRGFPTRQRQLFVCRESQSRISSSALTSETPRGGNIHCCWHLDRFPSKQRGASILLPVEAASVNTALGRRSLGSRFLFQKRKATGKFISQGVKETPRG
ncbi:uncharacterized protein LOC128854284 [Cuculus canorus]|uniref:uncharacterized protein LOC128854284 n=1 Tax=Cuculus canorus TaxID=55661 RepID=UPI0023AA696E|nr:uncharacterized protein LOC128854284 [Cuculus canorus]